MKKCDIREMDSPGKLNMLIVDDEEHILKSLKGLFRREFNIVTATSGEQALEIIRKHDTRFQVVLTDQRMAGMQGSELLKEVYKLYGETASILITGYSDMPSLVRAINEGHIYGYMSKPWEPEELRAMVDKAAERLRNVCYRRVSAPTGEFYKNFKCFIPNLISPVLHLMDSVQEFPRECDLEKQQDQIQWVKQICTNLVDSIELMNTMVRLKVDIVAKPIDFTALMAGAMDQVRFYADLKGVRLVNTVKEAYEIEADKTRLGQVLVCLLKNGIKYTPAQGTVTARASVEDNTVRVEIRDTGVGISEENLGDIFDPLNGVVTPGTNGEIGSGLELSICQDIMRFHGSVIRAAGSPGKGACFSFTLPGRKARP